jgi:hypothetical protein
MLSPTSAFLSGIEPRLSFWWNYSAAVFALSFLNWFIVTHFEFGGQTAIATDRHKSFKSASVFYVPSALSHGFR